MSDYNNIDFILSELNNNIISLKCNIDLVLMKCMKMTC